MTENKFMQTALDLARQSALEEKFPSVLLSLRMAKLSAQAEIGVNTAKTHFITQR